VRWVWRLLVLNLIAGTPGAASAREPTVASTERLAHDVAYLASDELEGRGLESRGLDLAADFIAQQFAQAGLQTNLVENSPYQRFRLGSKRGLGPDNSLELVSEDGTTRRLMAQRDFMPLSLSSSESFKGPLVFVGYGITAPEFDYDDYAKIDVQGKVVVALRHEPQAGQPDDDWFDGEKSTRHAQLAQKVINAKEHGAVALLLCSSGEKPLNQSAVGSTSTEAPLLRFDIGTLPPSKAIPVLHVQRTQLANVFPAGEDTLTDCEAQIDTTRQPQSRLLAGWVAQGQVSLVQVGRELRNVMAALPGKGAHAEETIIVGAHYDHLGQGNYGSLSSSAGKAIHNGADDNASGTAVLLEVARLLKQQSAQYPRQVLFIAFTAEELGLIGSQRYVQNPVVPLDHTIAMLNLDMVGRLRDKRLTVYGTGTSTVFPDLLAQTSPRWGLNLTSQPSGHGPSDHASFVDHRIPVLHFFTGFHPQYHRPEDDANTLNVDGMAAIAELTAALVIQLAEAEKRPEFQATDLLADLGEVSVSAPRLREFSRQLPKDRAVYFGVVRDTSVPGGSYRLLSILPGSPAERAGLRAGDLIISLGDQQLTSPEQLSEALGQKKPGDTDSLGVRRGSLEFTTNIVWQAPPNQ